MPSESNKRIAKNTLFLYLRMLIILVVSLYTSRIVLDKLGVEDFGIYNIVGGIIVMFSFLNNAMSNATQRFLSFELGRGDAIQLKKTFSMSMSTHISIALLALLLSETIGLWFVKTQLNIPEPRMHAAIWVYQFSVLSFIVNIIRVPYNASIIAYEKMSFFAYLSIIEVVLKLLAVYMLLLTSYDKLIFYSLLMFLVPLFCTLIFKLYCTKIFSICRYNFFWDKKLYLQLMSFSGWSMLGGLANVGAQQGGNILLNIFSGVTINAAFGIANQVSNAIYGFVSNFQIAFNPQIVKLYAVGDHNSLHKLMFRASLLSYYLLLVIAVPFVINTEAVLHLWLKDVPEYSAVFCQLMILCYLIDALQSPICTTILATGKIRNYEIWVSFLLFLNLPVSYYLLKIGWSPIFVLIVRLVLNFFIAIFRTFYIRNFLGFPSMKYFLDVVLRALLVTIIAFVFSFLFKNIISNTNSGFLMVTILSVLLTGMIIYIFGINKEEREFINSYLRKIF